jgi:hypothetical protein
MKIQAGAVPCDVHHRRLPAVSRNADSVLLPNLPFESNSADDSFDQIIGGFE